jgi:uroporphyrinogen decarboxylase
MNPTPDFERFKKVVKGEEAERVPLCEVLIGYSIMSQFLGREVTPEDVASQVEFWSKAGYDYIPIPVSLMTPGKVTDESRITRLLKKMVLAKKPNETDPKAWNLEYTSFIHDRSDLDQFPWEAAAEIDYSKLDAVGDLLPPGMKVVVVSGKIFTLTWMLMGFQNFSLNVVLDPGFVRDVFMKVATIQYSVLENVLARDYVGGVWAVDDMAFGSGPMISPEAFDEHVFPWYRKMADMCHQANSLFILHSDGDLTKLMPYLIDLGVDLLQPIDPSCMDIVAMKQEYAGRICLAGNVPNEMLRKATSAEVEKYVLHMIKHAGPGGGYCVGSGNSVPDWSDFDNFMAMRNTTLNHGKYPISI